MTPLAPAFDLAERACMGLASRWRNAYLRARGVRVGGYCWLRQVEVPRNHANVALDRCSLDRGVTLLCLGGGPDVRLSIGRGSYLNRGTFVDALDRVTIGRHVAIGPGCYITDHDHGGPTPAAGRWRSRWWPARRTSATTSGWGPTWSCSRA